MKSVKVGKWNYDSKKLPYFEYQGNLPYKCTLKNGKPVKLPNDPWFLLGNYRLTLFTHVSGEYELISGERAWARINQDNRKNSGKNHTIIQINEKQYKLTGLDSPVVNNEFTKKTFGCGFVNYQYKIDDVYINKNISVKPSNNVKEGSSGFLLTFEIKNEGQILKKINIEEFLGVNFTITQYQTLPKEEFPIKYVNNFVKSDDNQFGEISISIETKDSLLLTQQRDEMAKYDTFPPSVFIKSLSSNVKISGDDKGLFAKSFFELKQNEEISFSLIVGFSFENNSSQIEKICNELECGKKVFESISAFAEEWNKIIPDFPKETDEDLKRELRWHAYNLEAMATYSEFYDETKIPQGTIYDYDWGQHASARDNFQHGLPLVYYNPKLAKSILRYMLKRTTAFGEIRLVEMGNGYAVNERYFTSDQQLYYFLLLSEYLRVTKDYNFLNETVTPYPVKNQQEMTVASLTEKCFVFLRDTIGTGSHGLVKLLNSDWNDTVYYIEKVPYCMIFFSGESHMNLVMVLSIFQVLIQELKNVPALKKLTESMELYRSNIFTAFFNDLGQRTFPKRMYFNNKPYGEENMFLEPQGFTLQIDEFPIEKKKNLYEEMKNRVYKGEKLGAREQENPEFEDEGFDKGSRENGGFWWALNGPVVVGVSKFDKTEAKKLLKQMTLENFSKSFPEYWSSYWSAADNQESSLIQEEGLPDQSLEYWSIPVYCAHPHAWILYCYYKINE